MNLSNLATSSINNDLNAAEDCLVPPIADPILLN